MKIFNTIQSKNLDVYTQKEQHINSLQLMERAAEQCAAWLTKQYANTTPFVLFCGLGNNGGDGLAIARMLYYLNYNISVFVVKYSTKTSNDFDENFTMLTKLTSIKIIHSEYEIPQIDKKSIVVDAIFGAGLNRPLTGISKTLITHLNNCQNIKISIDIPSGLQYENNQHVETQSILKANYTLTFNYPKLSFLLPQTAHYVGNWHLLDIQLSSHYQEITPCDFKFVTEKTIHNLLISRNVFSHKGTYGHAEMIGGSYGKMGAVVLATKAILKSGAGLATAYTPNCGMQILQITVPEAMWTNNSDSDHFLRGDYISTQKTIGIGPGMGTQTETAYFLQQVLKNTTKPMAIDADALNILAANLDWMSEIPQQSILTPHPKEFSHLVGNFNNDTDKLDKLKKFADSHNCIVVLKGAHTAIAIPNETIYINSTGNAGMATGGSGDVLTGIITGLLAQQYSPKNAAILGVYIHGLSGDLAVKEMGKASLVASDLVAYLGKAFLHIENASHLIS